MSAWEKTKTAMTKAARSTQKAGRNAILKTEIMRLRSKVTDIKKEFGLQVYELFAAGNTEAANSCFIETRVKVQPLLDEIAKKEKEMTVEPGATAAAEAHAPDEPPPLGDE
jgi:hypothetical protein